MAPLEAFKHYHKCEPQFIMCDDETALELIVNYVQLNRNEVIPNSDAFIAVAYRNQMCPN